LNYYSENLQFAFASFGMQVSCYKCIVKEVFLLMHTQTVWGHKALNTVSTWVHCITLLKDILDPLLHDTTG